MYLQKLLEINVRINSTIVDNFSFKSTNRQLRIKDNGDIVSRDSSGFRDFDTSVLYSNYTLFFRNDLNVSRSATLTPGTWHGFRRQIAKEFKDAGKVNVYNFGCSDGSEAYSFALSMIDELGEKTAQKFFPIKAYDIDEDVLSVATSGKIPCDFEDLNRLSKNIKEKNASKLYDIDFSSSSSSYPLYFIPSSNLSLSVNFEKGNILEKVDEINPSNSLILCRNFWPYINPSDRINALEKLCSRIDETSRIVIGNYDKFAIMHLLEEFGFEEVVPLMYKKSSK